MDKEERSCRTLTVQNISMTATTKEYSVRARTAIKVLCLQSHDVDALRALGVEMGLEGSEVL